MGSENSSKTWLLPFWPCLAALLLWTSACGSTPGMDVEGGLAAAEPTAGQTAPAEPTAPAPVEDLPPTPTVAFADVVNIWLFQIGLRGPSSLEEWRERLERACDAPIWEAEPAALLTTEFVIEDGGDPTQPEFYSRRSSRSGPWLVSPSSAGIGFRPTPTIPQWNIGA